MKKINNLKDKKVSTSFSRNRRIKSFLFLFISVFIGISPYFSIKKPSLNTLIIISFLIFLYGMFVLSKNFKRDSIQQNFRPDESTLDLPNLDIIVAARDEQYVIQRLVERLFRLDYPSDKLNIFVIDDGSEDETPNILRKLSQQYQKLQILSRVKNAGGGKSGALNDALRLTSGEWVLILDADAQLRNDTLVKLIQYAQRGSWPAVQLRKSVINGSQNLLTKCQTIEMAMDTFFQIGRLSAGGATELRGNGQLIKKRILIESGSFNEDTVTDDLDLSLRLLLFGSEIGILWEPPVMEEAVETFPALFAQRQRWAEGGLQRYFDYGSDLIFGKINTLKKFDILFFFILQYALPIVALSDLVASLCFLRTPVYLPISITAFLLSAIASWFGCKKNEEISASKSTNIVTILIYLLYLSHWFIVIPLVTLKMSVFKKKLLWKKTIHKG